MQPPIGYVDPQATKGSVLTPHQRLIEMGLMRDGSLDECDVVFCAWPRYRYFRQLRSERNLGFRLNQIPHATQKLHHKKKFTRRLRHRSYVPRTYLAICLRPLQGVWVEKPYNIDRGVGIKFLRDPRGWWRKGHLLQRYVGDPWLVRGRKTEVRILARVEDDGSAEVYREGLVRVALLPFTLEDLDPRIHNANIRFQERSGAKEVEQHLLSDLMSDEKPIDAMVEIVHDTVGVIRREKRFGGTRDFELLGYDFVLDGGLRPHLLEINRFPGISFDHDVTRRFYLGMIRTLYRDICDATPQD